MKKVLFVANYNFVSSKMSEGISGGDRIFMEYIRYWQKHYHIALLGGEDVNKLVTRHGLTGFEFIKSDSLNTSDNPLAFVPLAIHTIRRLFTGIVAIQKNYTKLRSYDYVYSVSDFLPDFMPAFFLKLRHKKIKWIAAYYLFAPSPLSANNPYRSSPFRFVTGLFYWGIQKLTYQLALKFADYVVSCNEIDRKTFIKAGFPGKNIIAIYGGINLAEIKKVSTPKTKKITGVFMARFHLLKGPILAVKAWEKVIKKIPSATLAMIGSGKEEQSVRTYIARHRLKKNIKLYGFLTGDPKYKLLKSARLFIHSAIYETGGMAAAEGMACGLPVVAFDHEGFTYCYPKGLVRVKPIGDTEKMAETIIRLLKNEKEYKKVQKDANDLIQEWDWPKRAAYARRKLLK